MWDTAGWGFIRFHEGAHAGAPGYDQDVLARWAERVAQLWRRSDVFVYFNNDAFGYAIAVTFAWLANAARLSTTRVPSAGAA